MAGEWAASLTQYPNKCHDVVIDDSLALFGRSETHALLPFYNIAKLRTTILIKDLCFSCHSKIDK